MKFGCNYSYWQNNWSFTIAEYLEMTKRLADCGFDVLEISADHLYRMSEDDITALRKKGEECGVEFSTNSGPAKQYDLASIDQKTRENGIVYFKTIIDHMELLGSRVLVGAIYSFWPTDFSGVEDKEGAWERSIECLKIVGSYAEKKDIEIALEILNRNETYILTDHAEAIEYCRRVNCPAEKILLDTYHMNIEEDNMIDAVVNTGKAGLLSHVHVGECNRKLPGMNNSIDWPAFGKALRTVKFDKYVVMEPFLLSGGEVGHDCRVFRDLSGGADEDRRTELIKNSLKFLKQCCLGL